MKLKHVLQWMLVALLAFSFTACDNEPLEGTFITDDGDGTQVEDGQFVATINGETFTATSVAATLTDGVLVVSGFADNGDAISFAVTQAGPCTYDLSVLPNIAQFIPNGETGNPYISTGTSGGSGSLAIATFNSDDLTITGVFSFVGAREGVDSNGDPITETVDVTVGGFNDITFELVSGSAEASDCTGTGGGGGGGVDPVAAFFALVAGDEFVDVTFTSELVEVAGNPMVTLLASAANGATIRIDIPEGLGTGTFDFMDPISDGTKLIAIYTDQNGEVYTSDVGSGSITITEFGTVTGKLAASFSFLGTDPVDPGDTTTVNITQGLFNTDYVDNIGVENSMSADVDGVGYVPTSITMTQEPFQDVTILNIVSVDDLTNQSVTVSFAIDTEAGVYEMSPLFVDGTEKVGIYNPDIGNSILFKSDPGVLTITSYELSTGIIEGTFNFTAVDPTGNDSTEFAVTNGQFTVQIQ
ncbi:MAG: DUF6252 family protein [Bacteroidota bacterium]